ncbi:MAG TPA: PBP1A family penicillin-binding protein [Spirochaetota bacterium]|nr:PBP1A family penicillin-binding protein [Spirochaetota bacterium]HNT10399.1 PBP1A family penicillin-binding protein [Spirochaetota bacterium]HOS39472.1 PBP1A family penicillin-binding protein [Spirochaetota bacterium]HPU86961.1 PBP1A family penicillin-binding protein [Spirochaetota bacterium]
MRQIFDRAVSIALEVKDWVGAHKKIVFIYVPVILFVLFGAYVGVIYGAWRSDRDAALSKLSRYKRLIERTEELKAGTSFNSSEVDLEAKVVDIPTRIYDRNDEIIGEFFEQKREIVPFGFIPPILVKAVIASEDRDFRNHRGVSYKGIFRAFVNNLLHLRVVQGGSTITQQLAKVLFTDMDRSIKRKIYETFCAHEIEKRYDKDDIMSMYLNLINFGKGVYGVESTAKMYFGKSVNELNDVECAMIVATISNPGLYSPLYNLDNSVKKTHRIMKSLVDAGYVNQARAEYQYKRFLEKWEVAFDEKKRAKSSLIGSFVYSTYRVNRSPFFNEQIRRKLVEKWGEDVVKKGGLTVYTTVDATMQDAALHALRTGVSRQRDYHLRVARRLKDPTRYEQEINKARNVEGALVAIDPYTGEMLAYVGGYEFTSANQFDNASQMQRQPGSSFKPVVYAAAIENRDITPSTVLVDEKTTFRGKYSPRNYDGNYLGKIIAREALAKSINVVAVKVLNKTGYDRIFDMLGNGLDLDGSELTRRFGKTLSLALGTYDVSPLENCVLHSVIVNGGDYIAPYGIRYVKDYNGTIVWNNEEEMKKLIDERRAKMGKLLEPAACAVTVSMLKGVLEDGGTAHYTVKHRKIPFPIAGKTGTTSNYVDAWFVGYTADLVTAVWIGNKQGSVSLGGGRAGASIAAPVWVDFVTKAYRDKTPGDFKTPDEGITRQSICRDSGLVPRGEGTCPRIARDQIFIAGTEPGEYCTLHGGDKTKIAEGKDGAGTDAPESSKKSN